MVAIFIELDNRCILTISGDDQYTFLQGLVTNDIHLLDHQPALYAALLSPQGRFVHDFIITKNADGALRLEIEKNRQADLLKRLQVYKLRARVQIELAGSAWRILAFLGNLEDLPSVLRPYAYVDPRLPGLGVRLIIPHNEPLPQLSSFSEYDQHRLMLGIPDGSRDMMPDKAIPLEFRFDQLHAIAWSKGCYLGQELTARTRHLGVVRKSIFPAQFDGESPIFGGDVIANQQKVGTVLSSSKPWVLCRLKIDAVQEGLLLTYPGGTLKPLIPAWS